MNTRHAWWYRGLVVLITTLVISFLAGGAFGQEEEVPRIVSLSIRVSTETLDNLWFEMLTLLKQDDLKDALRKIEEVDLQKVKSGFKNLPPRSTVLLNFARTLHQQKRIAEALLLVEAARRLSPDFAPVYFTLAKLRIAQKTTDVYGFVRDTWKGLTIRYLDIGTLVVSANNVFSILGLSILLTGAVFVLFAFAYYRQAVFYYYFKHVIPLPVPVVVANILGWILIGLIVLVFGVFWGLLFLAVSLIPHVEKASRWILNLLFVAGGLLAFVLIAIGTTFNQFNSDYFQALRDLSYGTYSAKTVAALQERLRNDPRDNYALFGLAYIASYSGQQPAAIAAYDMISRTYPDYAAAQNNLGVLYHRQFLSTEDPQDYQLAQDAYDNAIRAGQRLFEPRYNVGQLLLTDFSQSGDAENQLSAARKLDMQQFTQQSRYLEYGVVTTDATLSLVALLKKLIQPASYTAGLEVANRLWSSGSRFDNPLYFSAVSAAFLLLSLLFGPHTASARKVTYCQMCGEPFTLKPQKKRRSRRTRESADEEPKKTRADAHHYCTQCTYIFKKKTTVKPEKRTQKINHIQLRQRLRAIIAKGGSLVFPGGGQIYYGYGMKGVLLAFGFYLGFSLLILKVLSNSLLIPEGYAGGSGVVLGVGAGLLGIAYVLNLFDISKLSPKNQ